jgi:phosphomannomutase
MADVGQLLQAVSAAKQAGNLSEPSAASIAHWLKADRYADYRDDIARLIEAQDWKELDEAFVGSIHFGTGGMRDPSGPGPNRMNLDTIADATQGLHDYLVEYLRSQGSSIRPSVAIAHDTRLNSRQFAQRAAAVLTANGAHVFLFDADRPTPELSFAVPFLGAAAGVVISASHNPPRDNGYKVYWSNGAMIVRPHDKGIVDKVEGVRSRDVAPPATLDEALLEIVGPDVDEAYQQYVAGMVLSHAREVKIAYTPLHGTGRWSIPPALRKAGFFDVHTLEAQATPDGHFPTVPDHKPNPEEPHALDAVIDFAREIGADIAMASDPDADRLAIAIPTPYGWQRLTGNQVAALMLHFVASELKRQGRLPRKGKGVVARTIVTTPLIDRICDDFGLRVVNHLLVGFKYIAEVALGCKPDETFLFGCEESLGYLRGTQVLDKDAAIAAVTIANLTAQLNADGKTVFDRLNEMYRRYGYHGEDLLNFYLTGLEGKRKMDAIMQSLRTEPPQEIAGQRILRMIDRKTLAELDVNTGERVGYVEGIPGDVLIFRTQHGNTVTIRPSGTEPKAKIYIAAREPVPAGATDDALEQLKQRTHETVAKLGQETLALAHSIAERS